MPPPYAVSAFHNQPDWPPGRTSRSSPSCSVGPDDGRGRPEARPLSVLRSGRVPAHLCIGRRIRQSEHKRKQGSGYTAHHGAPFGWSTAKRAGRRTGAPAKPLRKLKLLFWGSSVFFEGVPCAAERPPGLASMGVGSNWLFVPVCISTHQMFDQLLADQAILMAAPARLDRCNGLRTRSLKPRPVTVSNRPTVTPLSRAQLLHQLQTRRIRHHPPAHSDSRSTG